MGVAERGVSEKKLLLFRDPLGEFFGSKLLQLVARSGGRISFVLRRFHHRRDWGGSSARWLGESFDERIAVDQDLANVRQELGRPVLPPGEMKQLRRIVD